MYASLNIWTGRREECENIIRARILSWALSVACHTELVPFSSHVGMCLPILAASVPSHVPVRVLFHQLWTFPLCCVTYAPRSNNASPPPFSCQSVVRNSLCGEMAEEAAKKKNTPRARRCAKDNPPKSAKRHCALRRMMAFSVGLRWERKRKCCPRRPIA